MSLPYIEPTKNVAGGRRLPRSRGTYSKAEGNDGGLPPLLDGPVGWTASKIAMAAASKAVVIGVTAFEVRTGAKEFRAAMAEQEQQQQQQDDRRQPQLSCSARNTRAVAAAAMTEEERRRARHEALMEVVTKRYIESLTVW